MHRRTDARPSLGPARSGTACRFIRVVVICAVLSITLASGWFAAMQFQSPKQREADASAPTAREVTARVVRADLATVVSARATVEREFRTTIPLSGSASPEVVTGLPTSVGQSLGPGSALLEVNGRPLIAVPGQFPFYRDLSLGDSGPDVQQLQQGLAAAGLSVEADGDFGSRTRSAVASLYQRLGVTPPDANPESVGREHEGDVDIGIDADHTASPGSFVPRRDFVVVTAMPASVVSQPAVGTTLSNDSAATLEWGPEVGVATVAASAGTIMAPGMHGSIGGGGGDEHVVVNTVAAPDDAEEARVVVSGDADGFPSGWSERDDLLLQIDVDVAARGALVVPTRAIVTNGASGGHLLVRKAGGSFREVDVTEVGSLGGRSAVVPADRGSLRVGDEVRVR